MFQELFKRMDFITYIFLVLYAVAISAEWIYSQKRELRIYDSTDVRINLTLGIFTSILRILLKGVTIALWNYLYQNSVFKHETTFIELIYIFFLNEFIYYWFHRLSHSNKFLWAVHVNHHSSNYFNYSTATRNAVFNVFLYSIVWTILTIFGFEPQAILFIHSISIMLSFFQHTQFGLKLKYIDFVIINSSHHRVHHARNERYIDKNFGNILIIFDRIFGTFEKESEKPIFGIDKEINQSNVFEVIFHEWKDLIKKYRTH